MSALPRVKRFGSVAAKCASVALAASLAVAATPGEERVQVTGIRFWTLDSVTRVAIEGTGEFQQKFDRLYTPDRLFFDLVGTKKAIGGKGIYTVPVNDKQLKQIRVAQTSIGITRVVLDLETDVEFATSTLSNPFRLIIELRGKGAPKTPDVISSAPKQGKTETGAVIPAATTVPPPVMAQKEPAGKQRRPFVPPPSQTVKAEPVVISQMPPALGQRRGVPIGSAPYWAIRKYPPAPRVLQPQKENVLITGSAIGPTPAAKPSSALPVVTPAAVTAPPVLSSTRPEPAKKAGDSLTRALGLKIRRVVIDPGHGGHDVGSTGPTGFHEKDLVLDVARRLGEMIEEQMGSEVIFTRKDDTFIPLETRTAIANEHRADLFLSIHANSSQIKTASGVETYYLSFTTSKTALEVAARENASSERSVFELKDLLQKIALRDKVDESREFAARIQSSLFGTAKAAPGVKNRGLKKAPFIVLIGANMPSVLAEIGFISNPRDEALFRKPEQRQKIAESLLKGIQQYAGTLSHFQVAKVTGE